MAKSVTQETEASAFFAAAARLMFKHGIDEAMLAAGRGERSEVVQELMTLVGRYCRVRLHLLAKLARAHHVELIVLKGSDHVALVGSRRAMDLVREMFVSLQLQMVNHLHRAKAPSDVKGARLVSWRNLYLASWAQVVGERLAEQARLAEKDAEAEQPGVGLVLVGEGKLALQELHRLYPDSKTVAHQTGGRHGGADEGRADGSRADIGQSRVAGRAAIGTGR